MEEILRQGLPMLGLTVPEGAVEKLRAYYSLLEAKNQVMNLTAIRGEEDTARLHFLDCAGVLRALPEGCETLVDIGSGAGFPGLVLKILRPELRVTLLDSLQKRVTFQQETAAALGLEGIECRAGRAEEQKDMRGAYDAVTSRAVARLSVLAELCLPMVRTGGVFIAMKGPEPEEEAAEARRAFALLGGGEARIEKYTIPGTDTVHSLVMVKKERPTPGAYPRRFAAIKKSPL